MPSLKGACLKGSAAGRPKAVQKVVEICILHPHTINVQPKRGDDRQNWQLWMYMQQDNNIKNKCHTSYHTFEGCPNLQPDKLMIHSYAGLFEDLDTSQKYHHNQCQCHNFEMGYDHLFWRCLVVDDYEGYEGGWMRVGGG